jgi:hypothetical protein
VKYVLEAELQLGTDCDPRAPGGAVTVELCGSWEHEGACRWPHNSDIDSSRSPALFRTLFVANEDDAHEVRRRIEQALRSASEWEVLSVRERAVAPDEQALAARLAAD